MQKSQHQAEHRRLSLSGRSHESDNLLGTRQKVRPAEYLLSIVVGIAYPGEGDSDAIRSVSCGELLHLIGIRKVFLWHIKNVHQPSRRCGQRHCRGHQRHQLV